MDCLFCKIVEGKTPSMTLLENNYVKVIMDINPDNNGHVLVIPKKHFTDFTEMDNDTLGHINDATKQVKKYIYNALYPDGLKLIVNYGISQLIKHYHLHIIPVYKTYHEKENVEVIYNKIKNAIKD